MEPVEEQKTEEGTDKPPEGEQKTEMTEEGQTQEKQEVEEQKGTLSLKWYKQHHKLFYLWGLLTLVLLNLDMSCLCKL